MRKLLSVAIAAGVLVLGTASIASAAPPIDGNYVTPGLSGAYPPEQPVAADFTVQNGVIVKGFFYWPGTCTHTHPEIGTRQVPWEVSFDGAAYPIDAGGRFRIEHTESGVNTIQPPPHPGFPYSSTTVIQGTIDGPNASGTAVGQSDEQSFAFPGESEHCESANVPWSAQHKQGAGSVQACEDAREKVRKLKQKIKKAEGAKKKALKKKLKKAKEQQQAACR
jgi:hypothetical protein